MPNGSDKNFWRIRSTIAGFRARYQTWPDQVHVWPDYIHSLSQMLSPEDWSRLLQKVTLIASDPAVNEVPFVAVGPQDRRYRLWDADEEILRPIYREVDLWFDGIEPLSDWQAM